MGDTQQTVMALIKAAQGGSQEAIAQIQQIMEMAKMFEQALGSNKQTQQAPQKVKASLGTKLDYINKLKGVCPEGTEKVYLQKGGCMCKKKAEKGAELKKEQPKNEIQKFKAKQGCKAKKKK